MDDEVLVLSEELDEEAVEAGEDVPVDMAEVVARRVLAVVVELDRLAATLGTALARELAGEDLPAEHVEPVEPSGELGGEEVLETGWLGLALGDEHGWSSLGLRCGEGTLKPARGVGKAQSDGRPGCGGGLRSLR